MPNVSTAASKKEVADKDALPVGKDDKATYPRVTIRLTGDVGDAIEELQDATFAATPSEVIRRAIVIYHTLVKQKLLGNEPYIEKREGDLVKKIPLFL